MAAFKDKVAKITTGIADLLITKNRKYGNSALEPVRIFSKASAEEQILVRLDDKLSRIRSSATDEDEDVIQDLIGYLILLKIAREDKHVPEDEDLVQAFTDASKILNDELDIKTVKAINETTTAPSEGSEEAIQEAEEKFNSFIERRTEVWENIKFPAYGDVIQLSPSGNAKIRKEGHRSSGKFFDGEYYRDKQDFFRNYDFPPSTYIEFSEFRFGDYR